jgi:hypothetical protein
MGADHDIPPYLLSARNANRLAARRAMDDRVRARFRDSEYLQMLGLRALSRSRRGFVLSLAIAGAGTIAAAALFMAFWNENDATESGATRAAWALLGATAAIGVVYFALGGLERAVRRRQAGERLLLRAARQRERSEA